MVALAVVNAVGSRAVMLLNEAHNLLTTARVVASPPPSTRWYPLLDELTQEAEQEGKAAGSEHEASLDDCARAMLVAAAMFLSAEANDIEDQASLLHDGSSLSERLGKVAAEAGAMADALLDHAERGTWLRFASQQGSPRLSDAVLDRKNRVAMDFNPRRLLDSSRQRTAYNPVIAALVSAISACQPARAHSETPCIVVAYHASGRALELSAEDRELLENTVEKCASECASGLTIRSADGSYAQAVPLVPRRPRSPAETGSQLRGDLITDLIDSVKAAVSACRRSHGSDLLDALRDAAAAASPTTLVVISSGLTTVGGIELRQAGWNSETDKTAEGLGLRGLLPDLAGRRILLAGFGEVGDRATAALLGVCLAAGAASCTFISEEFSAALIAGPDRAHTSPGTVSTPTRRSSPQGPWWRRKPLEENIAKGPRGEPLDVKQAVARADRLQELIEADEVGGSLRHKSISRGVKLGTLLVLAIVDFPIMLWLSSWLINVDWMRTFGESVAASALAGALVAGLAGGLHLLGKGQRRNKNDRRSWMMAMTSIGDRIKATVVGAIVSMVGLVAFMVVSSTLTLAGVASTLTATLVGLLSIAASMMVYCVAFRDGSPERDDLLVHRRLAHKLLRMQSDRAAKARWLSYEIQELTRQCVDLTQSMDANERADLGKRLDQYSWEGGKEGVPTARVGLARSSTSPAPSL